MAKKKSYPKQPKQSASLNAWENYYDKCKEVDKHNAQLEADAKKKKSVIDKVKKLKK
jgi:1,4-dihydroxy-2-naphthoate octaprenyltransferase